MLFVEAKSSATNSGNSDQVAKSTMPLEKVGDAIKTKKATNSENTKRIKPGLGTVDTTKKRRKTATSSQASEKGASAAPPGEKKSEAESRKEYFDLHNSGHPKKDMMTRIELHEDYQIVHRGNLSEVSAFEEYDWDSDEEDNSKAT